MNDFEQRLQEAIERGRSQGRKQARDQQQARLSDEELRRRHAQMRLALSEHIEVCLRALKNHFPGFTYETLYGDRGWGGAVSRDDVHFGDGSRENLYSRLEMSVRPPSEYHVLEIVAKGTIRNKEVFVRNMFESVAEASMDKFLEVIDQWALQYAELYASKKESRS